MKPLQDSRTFNKGYVVAALCALCAAATISAADVLPPPPQDPAIDGNGVDVKSLAIMYSHKDVSIGPADYHGLQFNTYFSGWAFRNSFSSDLNDTTSCNGCGNVATDSVSVGNHNDSFRNGVPNTGDGSSVSGDSSQFVYTLKDGTTATFATQFAAYSPDGSTQITDWHCNSLAYPDGTTLTFNYEAASNGSSRLQSVTTNAGWQMKISYLSNDPATGWQWGFITRVTAINNAIEYCNPVADSCSLTKPWPYATYSNTSGPNNGSYTYITDAAGAQTRIYNGNNTFSIKTSDSATDNRIYSYTLAWDYGQNGNAYHVTQTSLDGIVTSYGYALTNNSTSTTVTASVPNYETRSYTSGVGAYSPASGPILTNYTDPLGRSDAFTYDGYARELTATRPEGNSTQFQYDNAATYPNNTRGNVTQKTATPKAGSGLPNLTESWQFPTCSWNTQKTCNQPTSYMDPKGNTTAYTYDPASGHVATETSPADANGIQPVKRYFYTALYAWILNGQGQYVQESTPVYMLTQERTCMRTATVSNACAGGSSDEVVTNYYYGPQNAGPNNLLVRGVAVTAAGSTRMTCYGYDIYGNKITETTPRAGLGSCP